MRYIISICLCLNMCLIAYAQSQSPTYKIGYLLDSTSPEIEGLLDELSVEITAVVGEDATVEFSDANTLVNDFNKSKALANYNSLLANGTDIIIAFGMVNNVVLSALDRFEKPTIVFGDLSAELSALDNETAKIPNYTSILTSQSYSEDLKLFKELANPKTVGVLIEKAFLENLPITEAFERIESDLDLDIRLIPFQNLDDILSNLDDVDAVYIAGGFYFTNSQMQQLADEFIERKLPSFTVNPVKDVRSGILASNYDKSGLNQFFRKIALTVESVVNGEPLTGSKTVIDAKPTLTVNFNTAEKIGLPLKYSLIATTTFVGNPNEIVADKTYNLVSVMQEVVAENLQLQTVSQNIALSEKDVKFAKSDYLPNVTAGATGTYVDPNLAEVSNGQNPEFTTNGNITLEQTVFSEAANANISIQKSLLEAQQENYNSEVLNIVFEAATAYFTALILKANLAIQNQNLELTKYNLKIAEENYEAGQAGKADVLRFRSEMAQNTQQMVEAINQLEQGYYTLNQVLNNPIDTKIDVEEAELKTGIFSNYNYEQLGQFLDDPRLKQPFVKFLIKEAMANAPELKALEYNIEATDRSERLFGAGRFLPTVGLQGQYNYEFSRSGVGTDFPAGFPAVPQDFYTLGLSVSIPIFNQNKQNINQQIARVQKEQLEISKSNVSLNIEKNVNDAVLDLINQISNIQLSEVFEITAKEALELTQTSYASGAVNIVQLLDAQNNYLQAQLASANANYNYLQSSMQLERSLGLFFLLQDSAEVEAFKQRFLEFLQTND